MFCDRIAACRVYQGEKYTDASPYDYYQKSKDHILINQETSDLLDRSEKIKTLSKTLLHL